MKVTGEQVREAVMAAGLTQIPHHQCAICFTWVAYYVDKGELRFDPSCDCSSSFWESRTWDSAAELINMQTNEESRNTFMARFGMKVTS